MKRYISLITGILAVLGSLYFLFLSLLAGFLLLMWAGAVSVLMLIVAVGIPMVGCLSGAVSVIYFFYPSKIKFYYTFPSWITVLALAYVLFLGPGLDCMIKAGEIRVFIEENNRDIPSQISGCALNEAIKLLDKHRQGDKRLRALQVMGKVRYNDARVNEILRKEIFQSEDSNARRVALESWCESKGNTLPALLEFGLCELLDDHDPAIKKLAAKVLTDKMSKAKGLPLTDLCGNYMAQKPLRTASEKGGEKAVIRTGETELILAVRKRDLGAIKSLVEKGSDINLYDWYGYTPLFHAIKHNNLEITKYLVSKGADVDIHPENGNTPLQEAIRYAHTMEMAELLVRHGADVNTQPGSKIMPLNMAIINKNFDKGYEQFKIGILLKQARLEAGFTQEQVAKKLHTKKSAISRIENHAEDIRLSTLVNYAQAVGKHLQLEVA